MVAIEGLVVVIGHKQRRLESFQQGFFSDIGVRVVDKRTGFHIAIGVNMEIVTASCDAAAYILAVILKINREDGLGGTVLPHFPVHELTLLRIGRRSVTASLPTGM